MADTCTFAHITDLHLRDVIPGTSSQATRQSRLVKGALRDLLATLKKQSVDLVVLTGDLLDVELPHDAARDELVTAEYRGLKAVLDDSGLRYHVLPGNHDDPDCLFQVFGRRQSFEHGAYEFVSFYDYQTAAQPVERTGTELQAFHDYLARSGPRNQVHLQHYLIYPERNERFPHTYANADVLLDGISKSDRVLLSVSGHYHKGCALERIDETYFFTGQAFTELHFPYALIHLNGQSVVVEQMDMQGHCGQSPLQSTYGVTGQWYQGNLHMHCAENSPCSSVPLQDGVSLFRQDDFLAVTDHDVVADLSAVKRQNPELVILEGFEHSVSNHMLFINEKADPLYETADKRDALQQAQDYLTIVCHPHGPKPDYWTIEEILEYPVKPTGIEVYNGHYSVGNWRTGGSGWDYTEFWGRCLDAGLRLYAYANDDFHDGEPDLKLAWNVVLAEGKSPAAILRALKSGSCYATTGLIIKSIQEYRGKIVIVFKETVSGRFVGPGNESLYAAETDIFEYQHQGEDYVRFEAEADGRKCWTQPMFKA